MDSRAIFEAIKDLEPFARQKSLERYVGNDAQLRLEVERLLEEFDAQPSSIEQNKSSEPGSTAFNPAAVEEYPETVAKGPDSQTVLLAGRYKLLAPLGEGGMGAVWLAEQKEPVKRRVAIKLIKAGMDSAQVLARFDAERQALALMDHPNIARVFDGGLTPERRPFFVMELVKGTPITEYSDRNGLSIRERLTLFTQVCEAIQHAHQKGIIHRDLKPSNILVAEIDGNRAVKVIDFGLAKAMHGAHTLTDLTMNTVQGVVVGTPLYMAPEQIQSNSFDIDTRVDVYSLGVVLYELLTGATPIDRERVKKVAWDEFRKMVVDEDPIKPSSRISTSDTLRDIAKARHVDAGKLASMVRGELDWIILKALEKERRRRYESASEFNADIQRYLNGDAVQAAPPSRLYQIRKFVSRHRIAVSVSAIVLATLLAGIVGTSYGLALANMAASREKKAREAAQANRQEAIAAVRQFAEVIASNETLKRHGDLSELRKSLLNSPLRFLQNLKSELVVENTETEQDLKELSDAATLVAKLTAELGNQKEGISLYKEAIDTLERSLSIVSDDFESFVKLVDCEFELARLLGKTGETIEECRVFQTTLVRLENHKFEESSQVKSLSFSRARVLLGLGRVYAVQAKDDLANEQYRVALEELNKSKSNSPVSFKHHQLEMEIKYEAAYVSLDNGRYSEAEMLLREAIQLGESRTQNGEVDLEIERMLAECHEVLAFALQDTGQIARSRKPMEKAKEIYERIFRNNPTSVEDAVQFSGAIHNMGNQFAMEYKPSAALKLFMQAKEINEALLVQSPDNAKVIRFLEANRVEIATTYGLVGRYSEAIVELKTLIDAAANAMDSGVASVEMLSHQAARLNNIAVVQLGMGEFEDAAENLRKAIALDQGALKMRPDDSLARIQLQKHADVLVEIGNQLRSPQLVAEGKELSVELASIDPDVFRLNKALQNGTGISEVPIDKLEAAAEAAVACRALATAADLYLELARRDPNGKTTRENWNALLAASIAAGTNLSLERQLSETETKAYRDVGRQTLAQILANARAEQPASNTAVRQMAFDRLRILEEDKILERVRSPFYLQQLEDSEREAWLILWKELENHLTTLKLTLRDQAELTDSALAAQRVQVTKNPSDTSRIQLSQQLSTQSLIRSYELRYAEAIQSIEESIEIRKEIHEQSPPNLQDRFSLLEDQIRLADLQFGLERIDQAYAILEAVEAELLREEANENDAVSWTYGRLLLSRSRIDASQGRLAAAHAHLDLAAGYCEPVFQMNLKHESVPSYHAVLREYLELAGRKQDPAFEKLARESLAEFVKRLPDYQLRMRMIDDVLLRGWDYSAEFMYILAMTSLETGNYQNAARLYEKALDPKRIDSLLYRKSSLYHGASAFVLAAEVLEFDSDQVHDEEAKRLRLAAHDLLEEAISGDLKHEEDSLNSIHEIPGRWERSPNLKSVRDPVFLEKMDTAERERWTKFWGKVRATGEELRRKLLSSGPTTDTRDEARATG